MSKSITGIISLLLAVSSLLPAMMGSVFAAWLSAVDLWRDTVTTGKPLKSCVAALTGHSMPAPNCTEHVAVLVLIWGMTELSHTRWNQRAALLFGLQAFNSLEKLEESSGQGNAVGITT